MEKRLKKIIYFATGNPASVADDLRAHFPNRDAASLRVVVPAPQASALLDCSSIPPACLIRFHSQLAPWIWLRLIWFAGIFSQTEIICWTTQHQHRFLKLFAFSLCGRVTFAQESGFRSSHSLVHLIWLEIRTALFPKWPVLIVGIASPPLIRNILADLRRSQPRAEFHGLLADPARDFAADFDFAIPMNASSMGAFFQALRFGLRFPFSTVAVPWDGNGHLALKCLLWLLPVWRLYVYNENLDVSSARNPVFLLRHFAWRIEKWRERQWLRIEKWRERRREIRRKLPVGIVVSSSPDYLPKILASVRACYPGVKLHALAPVELTTALKSHFDSFTTLPPGFRGFSMALTFSLRSRGRFKAWIVPFTNESYPWLKLMAFLLPLQKRQIFNELGDGFAARNPFFLLSHFYWRYLQIRERKQQRLRRLPVGVIGSASSYYLKKMLPSVRLQYPGAKLHAVLPRSLETPTAGMFDSTVLIRPGVLPLLVVCARLLWSRNRCQAWIVPFTNEPFRAMKFLALLLPLPQRHLFNEHGDGFSIGNRKLLWSHFQWRLRDRLTFQIVTAAAGQTRVARCAHLLAYSFRLLSGATLLARTLLRPVSKAPQPAATAIQLRPVHVDLFILEGASNAPSEGADSLPKVTKDSVHVDRIPPWQPAVRSTEHGD